MELLRQKRALQVDIVFIEESGKSDANVWKDGVIGAVFPEPGCTAQRKVLNMIFLDRSKNFKLDICIVSVVRKED